MRPLRIAAVAAIACSAIGIPAVTAPPARGADAPVTLAVEADTATLANGDVRAAIDRRTGRIRSLLFRGLELLAPGTGQGYWSFVGDRADKDGIGRFGARASLAVRADPAKNGGERAEVSCRLGFDGAGDALPMDVDLRYALGRGDRGLYAYAVWEHKPGDPAVSLAEARICLKLNPAVFDVLTVDARRRRLMPTGEDWDRGEPLNLKEARRMTTGVHKGEVEHKYDYAAVLADTPAYGWSGTRSRVGLWMINPSIEYISGGPTKVELTGHLDGNKEGLPTLLNMWQGSHYGGGPIHVGEGEAWTKVLGPFLLYCNAGADAEAMWKDALAQAETERKAWPYAWVADTAYPPAAARGGVTGRIVVSDPQAPKATAARAWVGLAAPAGTVKDAKGAPAAVDWQRDGRQYQFWARADAEGRFAIPHVRPGTYALHAFADGVLGEYRVDGVAVAAGPAKDLGTLAWTPVRHGRPLWEIGIPDRTAAEFRHGDHYWQWGLYLKYPEEFPDDVQYAVGKSDWSKDWNYCQPARIGKDGKASDTTWTIAFDLPQAPRGRATLRLAICGSRGGRVWVSVNGQEAGDTGDLPNSGVMHRDGIRGYWLERPIPFDASLLKAGANAIRLRARGRDWTMGVLYDYLRLELDEAGGGQ